MRYWEDIHVGDVFEFGPVEVREDEVIAFASAYDPQPFHVDVEAAAAGPFGGLIASGWHTASLFMGMYVRGLLHDTVSMGSPGVEQLRWLVPVRPGDELSARVRVVDSRPSSKNPRRGTIVSECEVLNQRGEVVMTLTARGLFGRREPAA
ncbi:MAG TPA: MaoC family dehydratase [Gaiellaceae bacterium]|jgi:acyl dehydratase|nr:MaoC family dehydratase [Gaiellaceae bacterium]